jgi:hypothetical protein
MLFMLKACHCYVLTKAKEITRFIHGNEMPVKLVGNGEIVSNSCLQYVAAFDTREASFRESKSGGDV